jgi:hypothetical protein
MDHETEFAFWQRQLEREERRRSRKKGTKRKTQEEIQKEVDRVEASKRRARFAVLPDWD